MTRSGLATAWRGERRTYTMMVLLIVAVTILTRGSALFLSSADWDEGVYIVTAQRWLLGELPYVAVWDQHPPGLPALLAIVQLIIPDPVLGARLAAALAVMTTALLLHRFCVRYLKLPTAGLVSGILYIVCISRWLGLAANTEVFNNACVTLAAYLLYGAAAHPALPGSPRKAVVAAAVLGVGLQIKYVVFPEAALLCLGYLVATYGKNKNYYDTVKTAGLLALAGCLPTGIVVLYFWANGALWPFLDANIGSNTAYLGLLPTLPTIVRFSLSGLAPILAPLIIIAYVTVRRVQRWTFRPALSPQLWILLWCIAAVADVCLPLKFANHYYFALYPPVCLGGAIALSVGAQRRRTDFAVGLAVLFATAIPFWVAGELRLGRGMKADAPRAVAKFLRQAGVRDAGVFIYDYRPVIYALAGVRPPTPYVFGAELAQFSHSSHVDGVAELQRIMDAEPEFVVVHVRPPDEPVPVVLDEVMTSRLATYDLVRQFDNGEDGAAVLLYRKSEQTSLK